MKQKERKALRQQREKERKERERENTDQKKVTAQEAINEIVSAVDTQITGRPEDQRMRGYTQGFLPGIDRGGIISSPEVRTILTTKSPTVRAQILEVLLTNITNFADNPEREDEPLLIDTNGAESGTTSLDKFASAEAKLRHEYDQVASSDPEAVGIAVASGRLLGRNAEQAIAHGSFQALKIGWSQRIYISLLESVRQFNAEQGAHGQEAEEETTEKTLLRKQKELEESRVHFRRLEKDARTHRTTVDWDRYDQLQAAIPRLEKAIEALAVACNRTSQVE